MRGSEDYNSFSADLLRDFHALNLSVEGLTRAVTPCSGSLVSTATNAHAHVGFNSEQNCENTSQYGE